MIAPLRKHVDSQDNPMEVVSAQAQQTGLAVTFAGFVALSSLTTAFVAIAVAADRSGTLLTAGGHIDLVQFGIPRTDSG